MGLRERNATRTRRHIVDAATALFRDHGYDKTTMEDVAAHAEVSASTLYRYFPAKEDLVVGGLGDPAAMADVVRSRPVEETVETAAGHAVLDFVSRVVADPGPLGVHGLIDDEPRPRARLLDWMDEAFEALVAALADRAGTSRDDITVTSCAWLCVHLLQHLKVRGDDDPVASTRRAMAELAERGPLVPHVPDGQ